MRNIVKCLTWFLLLSACAHSPQKSWSPSKSDYLFMSVRSGNSEIYILPAGKNEWVNLSNHPEPDNWPV